MTERPTLAVVGGTGDLGGGLAWRWARAGYPIVIGSRSADKGAAAAQQLRGNFPEASIEGTENAEAAAAAEIVVVTVPFAHQQPTLETLAGAVAGKIVVDTTVPLVPPRVARVQLPPEGSAAVIAQRILGDGVRVVSAFHNVGAEHLREDHEIDCDVLVFGDDLEARARVAALVEAAGMKAWEGGPLVNSAAAEALTSVLIGINKRYGIVGSGVRITGTPTQGR
ncbi:MAG TPA: NADPH-dependent F420 reductase [Thermoanaerobaculia bacterium]|nr:NADPH-dependent F420 reductase [Thermoanaerobaculia bacterium]